MKKYNCMVGGTNEATPLKEDISYHIELADRNVSRDIQTIANIAAIWGVEMAQDVWVRKGLAFPADYKP